MARESDLGSQRVIGRGWVALDRVTWQGWISLIYLSTRTDGQPSDTTPGAGDARERPLHCRGEDKVGAGSRQALGCACSSSSGWRARHARPLAAARRVQRLRGSARCTAAPAARPPPPRHRSNGERRGARRSRRRAAD